MPGYTIERVTVTPTGNLVYQLVRSDFTRASVMIPRRRATADLIAATIDHALANVVRPVRPL